MTTQAVKDTQAIIEDNLGQLPELIFQPPFYHLSLLLHVIDRPYLSHARSHSLQKSILLFC